MAFSRYQLYVGSYAAANAPGIHAFTFDTASGELTAGWSFTGIANPSFLALHPNGRWLYAVSETSQQSDGKGGEVWSLHLPDQVSDPQPLNHQASGGDWPCHLVIDGTGRWLLVSNYGTGTVGVLPILANGALGEMADLVQHHGSGRDPKRQEGPHAHSTIFTPDNRFAIVADLGIDQLVIYAFDPSTGHLLRHGHVDTRPGAGPRHLAFHPNGQYLYVAHELDNTVGVYDYHAERGGLVERQIIETLPPGAPESLIADIHLAPTGDRLYVSNRGDDSVAVFAIMERGQLERIAISTCGGNWPRNFAIAPGGQFLLVANQYSNEVTALPVLDANEVLDKPRSSVAVPGAACVQFAAL
jgi:6-phosphogluconolactonase